MENVSLTLATLKMDPVNPEKNATIDGTNRKRKEASPDQGTTRLPAEAVEACEVKDVEVVVAEEKAVEVAVVVTEVAA